MGCEPFANIDFLGSSNKIDNKRNFPGICQPLCKNDISQKLLQHLSRSLLFDPCSIERVQFSRKAGITIQELGYGSKAVFISQHCSVGRAKLGFDENNCPAGNSQDRVRLGRPPSTFL